MKKKTRLFNLLIIFALFLGACNLPSNNVQDIASTAAAETVAALLSATPISLVVLPSSTPLPALATLTPTPQSVFTNTPLASATAICSLAEFRSDITIPDGTVMTPGQTFTKKWRIKNIGACAWAGYTLVFDSGEAMGGPASKPIGALNPGQEIDLEVNLTAPATAGNYRGYWRITTNGNVLVPVVNGHNGTSFYVDIKVAAPTNTPAPAFAVTSVIYNVSGTCGNFHVSANITANGPGTVKYFWQANGSDDFEGTYNSTLVFASAGTLTTSTIDWSISATGSHYLRVYIDDPNHQFIGQSSNMVCP